MAESFSKVGTTPPVPAPVRRIFLLSPANICGVRGQQLLREQADSELAVRMRDAGAPLEEIFSFISGLYFRGKLAYARAFASPPADVSGIHVITASRGLLAPESPLCRDVMQEMAEVPIDATDLRYRVPLEFDARQLFERLDAECEVVLLGSIATRKYIEPLLNVFQSRLVFPVDFIGRGELSRGVLLLRAARDRAELTYAPADATLRRVQRTSKSPKMSTRSRKSSG